MIRFAVIGTSFITEWFLNAAKECNDLQFAAVCSRDSQKGKNFAQKYGAERVYTQPEELAKASDIDAVYIASPNSLHYEQAILMMNGKKHVLCEKPFASNARETEIMFETARKNNVVLLEGMRSAFDPGFQKIKENLGKLGTIRNVKFQFCQYSSRYDELKAGKRANVFSWDYSGGVLMDLGIYCIHPMVELFGVPNRVLANAVIVEGVDGAGSIIADYEGMQVNLSYSKISAGGSFGQIQGENGYMTISDIASPNQVTIHYNDGMEEVLENRSSGMNLIYEIKQWAKQIKEHSISEESRIVTQQTMQVVDQVRKQIGIHFLADDGTN